MSLILIVFLRCTDCDNLGPELQERFQDLKKREETLKLDRQRNLLHTQLQHLKKNANILVIGPDNAGKSNSLPFCCQKLLT